MTGNMKIVGFSRHFPVCVHPQWRCGADMDGVRGIGRNAIYHVMLPPESSGQGQQYHRLGHIPHHAQIQDTVIILSLRAEFEAAALKTMIHTGGKKDPVYVYGPFVPQRDITAHRLQDR